MIAFGCGGSQSYDQVFLLNAAADASLIAPDGGDASDASAGGSPSLDCTPAAAGCLAGAPCATACHCVLARDMPSSNVGISKCTLLPDPVPQVEVHYTVTFSGCGD